MDMDQRTRFIGGRAGGRIILLGDGTEISIGHPNDDDGDVDMEDRGEAEEAEENDLQEQVRKEVQSTDPGETEDGRNVREGTPAPDSSTGESSEPDSGSSSSKTTASANTDANVSASDAKQ